MFSEENRIWWYMIGVILLMGLVAYVGYYYALPVFRGERELVPSTQHVYADVPQFTINVNRNYQARFTTNYGSFVIDLAEKNAPENVNSFVFLASRGYYNGTKFHRLIPGLLLQGGDRNTLDDDANNDGKGGPGYLIKDEVNWDSLGLSQSKRTELLNKGYMSFDGVKSLALKRYSVAIANAGPGVNGSQFFIVLTSDSDQRVQALNGYHTVIGNVISGSETLAKINNVAVDDPNNNAPKPSQPIVLERVEIIVR
jgi:cyclophilin family peptidyl-prolyl cis-trans isomerase